MRRYSKLTIKNVKTSFVSNVFKSHRRKSQKAVLRRNGKEIPLDRNYFYNVTTGLHGDQFDTDPHSPTHGQMIGNDNGDYFEWVNELLALKESGPYQGSRTYATWVDAPLHLNHDEGYTCGFVADSIPNFNDKSIEMVMATEQAKEPALCIAIQNNEQTDVSMGCDLIWSICAHCNNVSFSDQDWCECLSDYKGRRHPRTGRHVCEILKDITGIELSHVTVGTGADRGAKNQSVLFTPGSKRVALRKISDIQAYYKTLTESTW